MRNNLRILLIIFTVLFAQCNVSCGNAQLMNENLMIKPDPSIQAQINYINSLTEDEKALSEISKLKEMDSLEHLLQQLFYFQLNANRMFHRKEITGADEANVYWGANWIIGILLGMARDKNGPPITYASAESVINVVLPYMETKDRHFKDEILYMMLATVEWVAAHESDYSKYELYIEKRKDNPPLTLIQYMYKKSPEEALSTLMRVYMEDPEEEKLLALHEEIIRKNIKSRDYTNAIPSLNELTQYKEWWIHLYVAEIMKQHPQIKSPDIIQRLRQDEHPLVQKVLNELGDR